MSAAAALPIAIGVGLSVTLGRLAVRIEARSRVRGLAAERGGLPPRVDAFVATRLARADLDVTSAAALRWWAIGVAAAGWFAVVVVPPLVVPAVVAAVLAGPIAVRVRAGHADRRARAALPAILDLAVAQLRAGGTITDAVHAVASRPGPLAPDFRRIVARLALGATTEDALTAWGQERPLPAVRAAAGALSMVVAVGGSAATPLEGLATSLRNDDAAAAEARALSAQARLSAIVVGLAPLAFLAFSMMADPGSSRVLVETTAGRICLIVGLGCEALAVWWMSRLVGADA